MWTTSALKGLARKDEPSLEIAGAFLHVLEQSEAFNNPSSVLGDVQASGLPRTRDTSHPQPKNWVGGSDCWFSASASPQLWPSPQAQGPKSGHPSGWTLLRGSSAPGSDRGREKGSFSAPAAPPTFLH